LVDIPFLLLRSWFLKKPYCLIDGFLYSREIFIFHGRLIPKKSSTLSGKKGISFLIKKLLERKVSYKGFKNNE